MLKVRLMPRKFGVMLLITSLVLPGLASSAEVYWMPNSVESGYTIMVPHINTAALVDELVALESSLKDHEQQLAQNIEKKRFTGKDMALSALMPGGIIYAAIRKHAEARAVRDFDRVADQIEEIGADISSLNRISG